MNVGIYRQDDMEVTALSQLYVLRDVLRGINDDRLLGLAGGNDVGGAAGIFVENLLEVHVSFLRLAERPAELRV
jgi:hypothetical protein